MANMVGTPERITQMAKELFREERSLKRLDGWFLIKESYMNHEPEYADMRPMERAANLLYRALEELPLSISENAIFAGTQRDAFARSYALINPSFKVESFAGYCDPTAVFDDIEPNEEFTRERIEKVRAYNGNTEYGRVLADAYAKAERYTGEVAFFMEQVTGHVVPDLRPTLKYGVNKFIADLDAKIAVEADDEKRSNMRAMKRALEGRGDARGPLRRHRPLADGKCAGRAQRTARQHGRGAGKSARPRRGDALRGHPELFADVAGHVRRAGPQPLRLLGG